MGARWYNAELGRWISPDSIIPEPGNPQALNRYSYVYNNPLRYQDPSGHVPKPPFPNNQFILTVAGTFQIPPQLLGALLQTIQDIDYDGLDFMEDAVVTTLLVQEKLGPVHLPWTTLLPDILSTGLAQMQYRTAENVENWLVEQSSRDPQKYAAMLEMLSPTDNRSQLATRLLDPDQATIYAAAHLRQIIEYYFGENVDIATLSDEDLAFVAAIYNDGIGSSRVTHYSDNKFGNYIMKNTLLEDWLAKLKSEQ